MWDHVGEAGTRQEAEVRISVLDPRQVYVNDNGEMSPALRAWNHGDRRGQPSLNVSGGGEWACHAG